MTQTTHLALPFLDAAQAQKHVTHNEALALIDALTQLAVSARNVTSPPTTPTEGDRLLIGAGATGDFAGKSDQIATFLAGGWSFLSPQPGWRAYVEAEQLLLLHDGAAWIDCGLSFRQLQNLSLLGVGATADVANPLLAKLNATLFTARTVGEGGSGDLRFALNKEGAAKTVSQLYESSSSARAETGLTGDDDFHVKVSADGATWKEAVVVDRTTGEVAFPSGGPTKVRVFASSRTYTPTPGLRFADVLLFGAGGGGGAPARGRFAAAQIGASQAIMIGAGGAGGAPQTVDSSAGANGATGGNTSFGALLIAFGGGSGAGGQIGGGSSGGAGGSPVMAGANGSGATGGAGALGVGGGGSAAAGAANLSLPFGSGGGGCSATGATAGAGGLNLPGPSGGGAGGGITAGNTPVNGGAGGTVYVAGAANAGSAGMTGGVKDGGAGGAWSNGVGPLEQAGGGGGGGAADLTAPGAGGAGGLCGGGGGGGGASRNGAASGAGGAGGAGYAIIFEFF
ncbi:MAG: DUF2793 domain-containing protein [Methylocystis sp.]|uniref:DUF2793 domain-containing protein n=1 Tax=Methylocystis sp. TaxID=1911079 RepID=UPI0039486BB8